MTFYYFAYGSCMCHIDLTRTMGEDMYKYLVGTAILTGYRLRFSRFSVKRQCGVLDIIPDHQQLVEGVLYNLPQRFSVELDKREAVFQQGYRREIIRVNSQEKIYHNVRTYVVVNKLNQEIAPNQNYSDTVIRGAISAGLSQTYCQRLSAHMAQLQRQKA
ncbi:MAG: gamma-glutamylcyclotransferase [Gloeocapsa sp. DLM2.Bin57]|nr:MAG: gamma-glutamylcyclotransferase [Gloeocapsa sp. DLM2.Bin57]